MQGSFNQGHPQFGVTSGMQCACNSLFSICSSTVRRVAIWKITDLDYILIKGNEIFKRIGKNCYLAFKDLPKHVTSGNINFIINMLVNEQGELTSNTKSTFLSSSFTRSERGDGLLFMTSGYTFCIIWNKIFFFFDPHSRNYNGAFTVNGTSILLKFSSVIQLQNYIFEIYYPLRRSDSLFYQIQYVSISSGSTCSPLFQDLNKKGTESDMKVTNLKNDIGTSEVHEQSVHEKERKFYYFRNIKDTLSHNQVNIEARKRMAIHFEKIKGTLKHDQLKE